MGWNAANRWFILIALVMAALAVHPRLLLQPIVVSFLFLALTMYILGRAGVLALSRDPQESLRSSWGLLWCLPPLFALWANLDVWFILGPIVFGLCWAATGLAHWIHSARPVPGKTLGLVFGVSVLACLVNPYHVHVFQLPPELAYLVVQASNPLRLSLTGEWVAGGRTMRELRRADPNFTWTLSALTNYYWKTPGLGWSVAAVAFVPLLILGLLSFTLAALVKPQPNAPPFHVGRFLLWLVFAVLALALYRMIPFFVLIAAPLTAMTLGEILLWQQTSAAVPAERRERGLKFARLVSVPFLLLLLCLAWYGGTFDTADFNSPRRVAWQIRPDASLQKAAETLGALQKDGACGNVFNASFDQANYLPWFAPGVKYCMDTRFALYANEVDTFTKTREALVGDRAGGDWQTLFEERHIDQIVMVNFIARDNLQRLLRWWFDAAHWRQRYGDTKVVVFSWSGPNRAWPIDTATDDRNARAFGKIAEVDRPPARGTMPPTETLSIWALYLEGSGAPSARIGAVNLERINYLVNNQLHPIYSMMSIQADPGKAPPLTLSFMAFCGSLADLQGIPGGGMTIAPSFAILLNDWTILPTHDFGPPALPIVMVRNARQAVAENPNVVENQMSLVEALQTLRRSQEDHWVRYRGGPHPAFLRDRIRQVQLIAGLYSIAQLQPDNPTHHQQLAELYAEQNMVDLALEHLQLAAKAWESRRASGRDDPKKLEATIKEYHQRVDRVDENVKKHLAKWKDLSAGRPPIEKAALAYKGYFDELRGDKVAKVPLALGKTALGVLLAQRETDIAALTPEEQVADLQLRFDLLIGMGRVDLVLESLQKENIRKALPPSIYAYFQLMAAGAIGDYEAMDKALLELEKSYREAARQSRRTSVRALFIVPDFYAPAALNTLAFAHLMQGNPALRHIHEQQNELYNAMTLRGIAVLEAGNTKHARAIFDATLKEADGTYFTEKPIAVRYLELLSAQKR